MSKTAKSTDNQLDWVTCKIALSGDVRHVVFRSQFDPVSIPELDIIAELHGESFISEITYCATTLSTLADEKIRLSNIYGDKVVDAKFPGRNPNMGMLAPDRPNGIDSDDLPTRVPSQGAPAPRPESDEEITERVKATVLSGSKPVKKTKIIDDKSED